MTDIMTKGFCELNEQEMLETDGGSLLVIGLVIISVAAGVSIGVTAAAGASASAAWRKADAAANQFIAAHPDSPAAQVLASKPRG